MSIYGGLRRENYILFVGCIVTRFGSMVNSMLTMILNQKLNLSATWVSAFLVGFSVLNMFSGYLYDNHGFMSSWTMVLIVAVLLICATAMLNLFVIKKRKY